MSHVVLATAGHIDHGKTELTRALTGVDTDRLPEEKARGITIDLGFAHCTLGGRKVAVIDVPGHERFVKNMLAGVGGIDLALLVVAADESVMPQTVEHLAILSLLEVPRGVVALTKCDLVDRETLEIARAEVREFVAGTFLAEAPIVAVSARTSEGMDELRSALAAAVAAAAERDARGPFRLHVDRAFSIKGFGTVVTGTVVAGRIEPGGELELSPAGLAVRVRGIEIHGEPAAEARAGSRAALNLGGVDLEAVARGQQLLSPAGFRPTSLADVRLRLLGSAPPLEDLARVRFHLGAAELLARVHLLGPSPRLEPGGQALAQLRLERPIVAWPGDRFIVRSYSPMTTIGGGVVIDAAPEKHRGRAEAAAARLAGLERAGARERLLERVGRAGARGVALAELVAAEGRLRPAIEADLGDAPVVRVEGGEPRWFAAEAWREREAAALAALAAFHAREPLREGMSREELCRRLFGEDAASARALLERLAAAGGVRLAGELVSLARHSVQVSPEERELMERVEERFRSARLEPPALKEALAPFGERRSRAEKLVPVLVRARRLVALPGGLYVHSEALEALKRLLAERIPPGRPFSVPEFKELAGVSRKYAIPLLEHLDAVRFTRRVGDARVRVGTAS